MAIRENPFDLRRQVERIVGNTDNLPSPPPLTPTEQTLSALLDTMAEVSEQTNQMVLYQEEILTSLIQLFNRPPEVNIEAPSAREIGQAVGNSIDIPKPLTAAELASVIKNSIPDYNILKELIQRYETSQKEVLARLKKLPSILAAPVQVETGPVTVGSVSSDVSDRADRRLGIVDNMIPPVETGLAKDATLAGKATEATLTTRASESTLATRASETTLSSLNSKDFATQATLVEVRDRLQTIADQDSAFKRALKFEPVAGEEVRRDETPDFDYHGLAPDGTAISATSWKVVRFEKTGGKITRVRFRTDVAWDNKATGW